MSFHYFTLSLIIDSTLPLTILSFHFMLLFHTTLSFQSALLYPIIPLYIAVTGCIHSTYSLHSVNSLYHFTLFCHSAVLYDSTLLYYSAIPLHSAILLYIIILFYHSTLHRCYTLLCYSTSLHKFSLSSILLQSTNSFYSTFNSTSPCNSTLLYSNIIFYSLIPLSSTPLHHSIPRDVQLFLLKLLHSLKNCCLVWNCCSLNYSDFSFILLIPHLIFTYLGVYCDCFKQFLLNLISSKVFSFLESF